MREIPLKFVAKPGGVSTDKVGSYPALEVISLFDSNAITNLGAFRYDPSKITLALVDTGAEESIADVDYLAGINVPESTMRILAAGVTGSAPVTLVNLHIFLPTLQILINTDVVCTSLKHIPCGPQLVLGRRFLRLGRLHMDWVNNDFHFAIP